MARKSVNTTLEEELYKQIQILAVQLGKRTNDLMEEGMRYILEKYKQK
jgi:hypothetical protein